MRSLGRVTNTSSLSITRDREACPTRSTRGRARTRDRRVGRASHFFNPVPVMELLEIVRGVRTSDATVDRALAFAAQVGKKPIVVKRHARASRPAASGVIAGREAIRMLESGVASAEDIDTRRWSSATATPWAR
jgi:3-hydroxybutyryl-CoA dehydrogenase